VTGGRSERDDLSNSRRDLLRGLAKHAVTCGVSASPARDEEVQPFASTVAECRRRQRPKHGLGRHAEAQQLAVFPWQSVDLESRGQTVGREPAGMLNPGARYTGPTTAFRITARANCCPPNSKAATSSPSTGRRGAENGTGGHAIAATLCRRNASLYWMPTSSTAACAFCMSSPDGGRSRASSSRVRTDLLVHRFHDADRIRDARGFSFSPRRVG
jgi:hypothetical protein